MTNKVKTMAGQAEVGVRVLDEYDATVEVGLRTVVHGAAIERTHEGETTVELPQIDKLLATAAIARCLMTVRLRGPEIKAMRKIMGMTLADLAGRMDERTAVETVSRWEKENQPMGGYAEKLLRLLICEELREHAPGADYNASMISNLRVKDPWITDASFEVPYVHLSRIKVKEHGTTIDAWNEQLRDAA